MKNTFGNNISITLFGESHGPMIGATVDGLPSGIKTDLEYIKACLRMRGAYGKISTARQEKDEPIIISGAFAGFTTGTPLTVLIENTSTSQKDYSELFDTPRPSHADYTAAVKYGEWRDYRGGGHFSGRITAALVAVGAILRSALEKKNIFIGTHISRLGGISDRGFIEYASDIDVLNSKLFPVLSDESAELMYKRIEDVAKDGDSVGGVLETAVIGIPAGVGEPWFDTLEGMISHAVFSIPAVKGVEFGSGFEIADMLGSDANDPFTTDGEKIFTSSNNNGGINGGISNGMPIVFRTAVKPTPSIYKEQKSVSISRKEERTLKIEGRHDPAIVHRARAVVDAVTAIALADMLATKFGTDWLRDN